TQALRRRRRAPATVGRRRQGRGAGHARPALLPAAARALRAARPRGRFHHGAFIMLIGVPKEIKNHEYRVGLTPSSVRELVALGHQVLVERNAGDGIGATDAEYAQAGAAIVEGAEEVFARAQMIVKVKEPQAVERARLK